MTESLDRVKAEMEERGSNMIDAGPLVRIKQALTRIKTECTQMDVRIGVVREKLHSVCNTFLSGKCKVFYS